jgi:hypothetical protein
VEITEQEEKVLQAARAHADALAVLRGQPPFSTWDAAKIEMTRQELVFEAITLSDEREPGPSIPMGAPAPPDLVELMKRFMLRP